MPVCLLVNEIDVDLIDQIPGCCQQLVGLQQVALPVDPSLSIGPVAVFPNALTSSVAHQLVAAPCAGADQSDPPQTAAGQALAGGKCRAGKVLRRPQRLGSTDEAGAARHRHALPAHHAAAMGAAAEGVHVVQHHGMEGERRRVPDQAILQARHVGIRLAETAFDRCAALHTTDDRDRQANTVTTDQKAVHGLYAMLACLRGKAAIWGCSPAVLGQAATGSATGSAAQPLDQPGRGHEIHPVRIETAKRVAVQRLDHHTIVCIGRARNNGSSAHDTIRCLGTRHKIQSVRAQTQDIARPVNTDDCNAPVCQHITVSDPGGIGSSVGDLLLDSGSQVGSDGQSLGLFNPLPPAPVRRFYEVFGFQTVRRREAIPPLPRQPLSDID